MGPELRPDRYYLLSDAGSFFFDPAGDNTGSYPLVSSAVRRLSLLITALPV
jgi:hypothetical protein